jgi:hypothetical protein
MKKIEELLNIAEAGAKILACSLAAYVAARFILAWIRG